MAVETVGADDGAVASRRLLRPFVVEALAAPTGLELHAALVDLTRRGDLSAREWVEVTAGWKQMEGYCAAGKLTSVGEVDRAMAPSSDAVAGPGRTDSVRPAADELAPALGIAPRTASHLVALTRRLDSLPAALDALAEGRMDLAQVRVMDQVVRDLPGPAKATVEAAAVAWAPRSTARRLHADLAAEAMRVDPAHAATACERGVAERDVSLRPSPLPGCRRMVLDLPTVPATAGWLALNAAAKNTKRQGMRPDGAPENRTVAQLRADIGVALLTGQGDAETLRIPTPEELAALAEVQVVVAADTLAPNPRAGTSDRADLPANIPGIGPVDGATVRDLATRTPWRRLVADPATGTLIHADDTVHPPTAGETGTGARLQRLLDEPLTPAPRDDESRYRPSARLRRHVQTRDATCIGPACFHPARDSQLDHTINHGERDEHGRLGTTTADGLGSLCERIHNAKTHGGWQLQQPKPGQFTWTSPTGRTYTRRARPLIPGWRRRRERPPPDA